jgi:hypothetical protein
MSPLEALAEPLPDRTEYYRFCSLHCIQFRSLIESAVDWFDLNANRVTMGRIMKIAWQFSRRPDMMQTISPVWQYVDPVPCWRDKAGSNAFCLAYSPDATRNTMRADKLACRWHRKAQP